MSALTALGLLAGWAVLLWLGFGFLDYLHSRKSVDAFDRSVAAISEEDAQMINEIRAESGQKPL